MWKRLIFKGLPFADQVNQRVTGLSCSKEKALITCGLLLSLLGTFSLMEQ